MHNRIGVTMDITALFELIETTALALCLMCVWGLFVVTKGE